ncbi:unnamed protein product [Aphis gossypii]|uniref:Uncharacterized protein n=1 Tax=Aphis gossypii TaxID=80765 RepID=A0A9P0NDC9_APHGO|nr:unnamed protein product [Aphis gossypii]
MSSCSTWIFCFFFSRHTKYLYNYNISFLKIFLSNLFFFFYSHFVLSFFIFVIMEAQIIPYDFGCPLCTKIYFIRLGFFQIKDFMCKFLGFYFI